MKIVSLQHWNVLKRQTALNPAYTRSLESRPGDAPAASARALVGVSDDERAR
jgi:hypothetical protein